MVKVHDYIPDIKVDLRYSTTNNFTGKKIYNFKEAYLRYGTVVKLKRVQKQLKKDNLTLLIWDAYRPVSAQRKLWKICPDPTYVANPNRGYSSHSRGNTVDVSICAAARKNAKKLENIMKKQGFVPYSGEWWHFSDTCKYPVQKKNTMK